MTTSATDNPAQVIISSIGTGGAPGADGTDGIGFNNVRKTMIDNPVCYLYKNNSIVDGLNGLLTVTRAVGGSYTDIYGVSQSALADEPREEVKGWLITNDETDSFNVYNNIPLLSAGFTAIIDVGTYTSGTASQDILVVPSTTGDLFIFGTDSSNNFVASIVGDDFVTYSATTTISSQVTSLTVVIITYDSGVLNIYVDNVLAGTVTVASGEIDTIDTAGTTVINGDFTINLAGVRFYDIILNIDEIEYLS